jgi:hypothetical protein
MLGPILTANLAAAPAQLSFSAADLGIGGYRNRPRLLGAHANQVVRELVDVWLGGSLGFASLAFVVGFLIPPA